MFKHVINLHSVGKVNGNLWSKVEYHSTPLLFKRKWTLERRMNAQTPRWMRRARPSRYRALNKIIKKVRRQKKFPGKYRYFGSSIPGLLQHIPEVWDQLKPMDRLVEYVNFSDVIVESWQRRGMQGVQKLEGKLKHFYKNRLPQCDMAYSLHLKDPHYWTGERLATTLGLPRDVVWGELILRELKDVVDSRMDNQPKDFCWDKIVEIYGPRLKGRDPRKRRMYHEVKVRSAVHEFKTEDDMYEELLGFCENSLPYKTSDDELPLWAKIPFTKRELENVGEIVERTPQTSLATETAHSRLENNFNFLPRIDVEGMQGIHTQSHKHVFVEIGRKVTDASRRYIVREVDGTLRIANQNEVDFVNRRGTLKKVNNPFGGRKGGYRKKNLDRFRQRGRRLYQ